MNTLLLLVLALLVGFVLLAWAADRFIESSIVIAELFKVSPLLIGMVLVGFGTALPELVVSALAALKGEPALSIGNVVGSNVANIGMCLGITLLIKPLVVHSRIVKVDFWVLFAITLFVGAVFWMGTLGRLSGVILFSMLIVYLYWIFDRDKKGKTLEDQMAKEYEKELPSIVMKPVVAWSWWLFSLVLVFVSSEVLIKSAVGIGQWFHVSSLLIGLTIVAIGTSLPELAATIIAARRNEHDIAVGNVIGSNIFNLLGVLAMPALLSPSQLSSELFRRDYPVMLGITALFWVLTVSPPKKGHLSRLSGLCLCLVFVAYMGYLIWSR